MLRLLTNPIFLRMAIAFFIAVAVMLLFIWVVRRLRQSITDESQFDSRAAAGSSIEFSIAAYQGVIQKFKEQERELARLRDQERQRAAASEKINTAVLAQLSSGVLLLNKMGLVQQANPAARKIFGYASPVGFHARDLFKGVASVLIPPAAEAASGPAPLLQQLQQCIRTGEPAQRIEAEYATPQGDKRVLGISLSSVRDPDGDAIAVACLVSDLSEITELSRQVRLRENLASLGEMSAGIAHEFKNSLATISGYAQMLGKENDAATVHDFAGKIAKESSSLTRVVTDFLNFARPNGASPGALVAGAESLRLRELLEECARSYDLQLNLDRCPASATLSGDLTAWRQAFSNLLRNSSEAASEGKKARVEVAVEEDANHLRIKLRDNCGGIPQDQLEKIFIPFFTTKAGGTGLGLALVHRIITQHGGAIVANSSSDGTEFTITVPKALKTASVSA
jgi:signal transduction histidine kinase